MGCFSTYRVRQTERQKKYDTEVLANIGESGTELSFGKATGEGKPNGIGSEMSLI